MNKKARLVAAYLKGRPIWCSWQVTPRCESACAFCDHRAEVGRLEPDLETCRAIVGELTSQGSLLVSLSGGEPFLRSDLPELVSLIAAAHFPLLTTDGCLVTAERARAVWAAGLEAASVRLDHADAARQDAAAGVPGAHARAVAGLSVLARARTRPSQQVNVKARIQDADLAGLPDLLRLAADHGASVTVEPTFPLVHPAPGAGVLAEKLRELKARHTNLRSGRHFLAHFAEALEAGVGGCRAGRAFFNVDHQGRVSKCVEFRGPDERVGSLSELGMATVADRLRAVHAGNDCRSCWYSYRAEIESLYTVGGFLRALPDLVRG
ncbi:MAG TPA: radical SAM protein [Vicinamibacteria bacterium]|nr:radical SAM protein [Vicinamibacteria bacterium]